MKNNNNNSFDILSAVYMILYKNGLSGFPI